MEFTYIRNRIREYETYHLVKEILLLLKEEEKKDVSHLSPILLLLKWTFQFSEEKYPYKYASRGDVLRLLKHIYKLEEEKNFFMIHEGVGINKLLNVLSYQQSYLQIKVWKDSFARQNLLFHDLKSRYSIEEVFYKKSGLTIQEFLLLIYILYLYINPDRYGLDWHYNGWINENFFNLTKGLFNESKISSFLRLLTFPTNKKSDVIQKHGKVKSYDLQPFEISIFTQYPLMLFESRIIVIHRNIFNYTTNFYLYDYLKTIDNEKFSEEFGKRLEKYVEIGLKEINIPYLTENELRNRYSGKIVDFLVDENILIECKAIEIEPYPNIHPDDKVIINWLKKSIIKAYCNQMLSIVSQNDKDEFWGIILTYKETHFGTGSDAWNSFLKTPTLETCKTNRYTYEKIPPENLFFIDLAVWDKLILIIKEGKASLKEILTKARENNKNDRTKKYLFSNHLDCYDPGPVNQDYLIKGYQFITDILKSMK